MDTVRQTKIKQIIIIQQVFIIKHFLDEENKNISDYTLTENKLQLFKFDDDFTCHCFG